MKSIRTSILAVAVLAILTGCASSQNKDAAYGSGIGAAAGAALGAIVGNQSGHAGTGAALGALLGGGMGALIGHRMDKQRQELAQIAETRRTDQGLITQLKSDILFSSGHSMLKSGAKNNILQLASVIKKYPEDVLTIRGYTDSTGSPAVNRRLSMARARAVKYELMEGGVPGNTISVVGMGSADPIASNRTSAGRAQNRRVEIQITVDKSKVPKAG